MKNRDSLATIDHFSPEKRKQKMNKNKRERERKRNKCQRRVKVLSSRTESFCV